MNLSNLNDYLQTLATVGAIIGLLMVGYQVSESNRIASQQMASSAFNLWTQAAISEVESGVLNTVAKSLTNPDELTLTDKL
ncbi:hypothetical protein [Congregibacter sp.]|uniref:hypothetical protein n=1 Tax=Congregibacter sp. TaxID=2744308 RepID=UPI003F6CF048